MWGLRSAPTYRFTKVELAGNEQQGDELRELGGLRGDELHGVELHDD